MTKEEYQQYVNENWNSGTPVSPLEDLYVMTAGLGGEAGEVLEELKKRVRDGSKNEDKVLLELGDVLYYLTRISSYFGFSLEDVMYYNKKKLDARRAKKEMLYNEKRA